MGRAPCCDKTAVKKGPWSPEEDALLKSHIELHGTGGNWIALPHKIGLKRCGKSCRLRWLNYLRPNIKHGGFTEEEDDVICSLYMSIGSRWSIIAAQLPGRTDNDIKNYWNTRLKKKLFGKHRNLIEEADQHVSFGFKQKIATKRSSSVETENHHDHVLNVNDEALNQTLYSWPDHSSFAMQEQSIERQEPVKNPNEIMGEKFSQETNRFCFDASSCYHYGSHGSVVIASSSASLNSMSNSSDSPMQTSTLYNTDVDQAIFAGFENLPVELLNDIINSTMEELDYYGVAMMNNKSREVAMSNAADQSYTWDDNSSMLNFPYYEM